MNRGSFRKPLLHRNYSIERLGRKSSINALAPTNAKPDADGFESIDAYFPDDNENSTNQAGTASASAVTPKKPAPWRIDPSPMKPSFPSLPATEEYEVPVQDDAPFGHEEKGNGPPFVASPDDDDREITFKQRIRPRPSISPRSERQKSGSMRRVHRKRSLLPEMLVDPTEAAGEEDDDGKRRSGRKRFAPLAFWENERVVYGRRNSTRMPVIVDVVKRSETEPAKKRRRIRRRKPAQHTETSSLEKKRVNAMGIVQDFDTQQEVEAQLALSQALVRGEPVPGAEFLIHTMFVEGGFMSAGVLIFPPNTAKPSRNSAKHALVFHVIEGRVEVRVHRSEFTVFRGCQFYVPRGNQYSLRNVGEGEARLFFCHCKDAASSA